MPRGASSTTGPPSASRTPCGGCGARTAGTTSRTCRRARRRTRTAASCRRCRRPSGRPAPFPRSSSLRRAGATTTTCPRFRSGRISRASRTSSRRPRSVLCSTAAPRIRTTPRTRPSTRRPPLCSRPRASLGPTTTRGRATQPGPRWRSTSRCLSRLPRRSPSRRAWRPCTPSRGCCAWATRCCATRTSMEGCTGCSPRTASTTASR
mmetsp:Transcript_109091/g.304982  ORF Transcript_109091/g.304982 Transcript_109091/m.304982 type:complete len:207 (+) Transcript_109091:129-749(+)